MITALDGIKLLTSDIASAATAMERLLGCPVVAGEESASVRLANMALDLVASEDGSEGLAGLAFAVESIDQAHRICERRALKPGTPVAFAEADANGLREGRHIDLDIAATFGVPAASSAPNDCIFSQDLPDPGFLQLVKVVADGSAAPADFELSATNGTQTISGAGGTPVRPWRPETGRCRSLRI